MRVGAKHVCATTTQLAYTDRVFVRMYREEALSGQKMKCVFCHERITRANATADHLVARSRGGRTERKNIRAACKPCNSAKSNGKPTWFRDVLHGTGIPLGDRGLTAAWVRFRLNRRLEKAERRICRAVGMAL